MSDRTYSAHLANSSRERGNYLCKMSDGNRVYVSKILNLLYKTVFDILSKVELVKIAPPFQLVEKTTNLLVNIH